MASDLRCEEVLHILDEDDENDTSREFETMMAGSSDPNPGLEFDNAGGASSDQQMIPNISSSENNLHHSDHHIQDQDDLHGSHQFCNAYKDTALLDNTKVLKNMLDLEEFYLPDISIYEDIQDEIQIHMRKIVTEWMLDVCIDQRCHTDVFLLSTNVMDRFLAQVKLPKRQFQLLGATSIFLASKMVEPSPISALTLIKCTADTYDREELLSMELLILSKLKWDLTAITSYDYLDYMINSLDLQDQNVSVMAEVETKVRRNTEKLVTLCATDETFMSMPPSLVAASALVTALEQDKTISNKVNLNHIIGCIRHNTNLEMAHLKNCKHLMEKIFLPTSEQSSTTSDFHSGHHSSTEPYPSTTSSNTIRHRSRSFHVSENVPSSEGADQTTPTEVFSVSALHVT